MIYGCSTRPDRLGWPTLYWDDGTDRFRIVLTGTNRGVKVSLTLDNQQDYRFNGRFYSLEDRMGSTTEQALRNTGVKDPGLMDHLPR